MENDAQELEDERLDETAEEEADAAALDASEDVKGEGEEEKAEEKAGEKKEPKKGLFGKKKDKNNKIEQLESLVRELQDKCMRQMAEFENFRKRTDREKSQMFDSGASHVVEKLLPVVDNFERGLSQAPPEGEAFADGMRQIHKQLVKMLDDLGVTPIEALGKEFDPNFHNAVMQVEASEEYPSGTVAQEMQKGYMYREQIVRHSMVAVAQ